jgi:hypothetical protein
MAIKVIKGNEAINAPNLSENFAISVINTISKVVTISFMIIKDMIIF